MSPPKATTVRRKPKKTVAADTLDQLPCKGLTCSSIFTSKTSLRSSLMRKKGDICRRCINLRKAIECAKSIEANLSDNMNTFRNFHSSIIQLNLITIDDIIAAIAKLEPLPAAVLPSYLKRTTTGNVFPVVTMNIIRLLHGTFKCSMPSKPTSIDIVFNQMSSDNSTQANHNICKCTKDHLFFAVETAASCPNFGGISSFFSTSKRVSMAQATLQTIATPDENKLLPDVNMPSKNNENKNRKNFRRNVSRNYSRNRSILHDITNTPPQPPSYLAARPTETDLNKIGHVNNMLSNFVVSYFFKIMAREFQNILYPEFLFDLIKRDGGWKLFVENYRVAGTYSWLLETISQHNSICLVPICYHAHWTLLVRRFIRNSWKIFFINSVAQGSDKRFSDWQALFSDDDLFTGEWIKVKIFQQSELECGARVCLHGVCFALYQKKVRILSMI